MLTPLQAGPLKSDSGTISHNWLSVPGRNVMRDGQTVTIYDGGVATLTGKRGTLTIRNRNEWVDFARDANGDGQDDGIAHQDLEGRARDRPVRRDRREGARWRDRPR